MSKQAFSRFAAKNGRSRASPGAGSGMRRELTLEELLAAPIVLTLMHRDGVTPQSVRALVLSVANATVRSR
jgi:hypothetical protein